MINNFFERNKKALLYVGVLILAVLGTFLLSITFNVRYIVLPEGTDFKSFNAKYVIPFDTQRVSYESIKKFNEIKQILTREYYKNVDENKLIEGSIRGMADALEDPYTVYFDKEHMKMFSEKAEGSYVGIGVSINMGEDGLVNILEAFNGSPAQKAGIKKGDKIIKVNDKDVTSIRDDGLIIKMIKGEENTKVKLTIYRLTEGKSIDFDIIRKKIKISNIQGKLLENNIGYIKIATFDSEISHYFNNELNRLLQTGIRALIIDVRDNPGGDYEQVVSIADRLLPKGTVVYTENRRGEKHFEYSDETELKMPIAILVNGYSASASEVLAGALKDHKKGKLVGTKTFGKGLVQSVMQLSDGSGVKVTIARYFTPSGVCIQGKGIEPNVSIDISEKYKDVPISNVPEEEDTQLKKAIELVKGD